MTKAEFVKKAKENNYTDEQIQEFEDLREEMKRDTEKHLFYYRQLKRNGLLRFVIKQSFL